jgi:uncharacterized membrane protein YhaH (DUF805 family)
MDFEKAVSKAFANFGNFSGRADRAEYWSFYLFAFLVVGGAVFCDMAYSGQTGRLSLLALLAVFLPCVAVTTRRLHDTDRSGWLQLVTVVPIIGPLMLFIWLLSPGSRGTNAYDA